MKNLVGSIGPFVLAAAVLTPVGAIGQPEATMKAVRLHAHGETNEVLAYEDAPIPSPAAGHLLIEVHAASVIPGDWKTRDGFFGDLTSLMPFTLGFDVSGVVIEIGDGVDAFEVGDEVFAYLSGAGAFAEYAVGPAEVFARKPAGVTHEQAASVPVSGLCAWQGLTELADLQAGQSILIQAGAGGVGHLAVQIAHSLGATVYTTASSRNHEFLKELGADVVIDYRTERFEEVVGDVDVVFDLVGGEVQERSFETLRPGGLLIAVTDRPSAELAREHGVRAEFLATRSSGESLSQLVQAMARGEVVPHVSEVFPLSRTLEAMDRNERGHTRGKIVIKVR
jgi:NADPH:quinone reductase-like Zn-dependent oxidoreductase